mgnify:CR=1 FL=1
MSSDSKFDPLPEIPLQHPTGIAESEPKYLERCFATFPVLVLVGSVQGRGAEPCCRRPTRFFVVGLGVQSLPQPAHINLTK